MHAEKLHNTVFQVLIFRHIQLDELWANVRHKSQEVWLWVAMEATMKVIPVMKLGPRTLDMAMGVIHELRQRMPSRCTPIFTSDGLKLYFYALTAHFGNWVLWEGMGKPMREITAIFIYAQVKKIHRRRRFVKVEYHILLGKLEKLLVGLKAMGLSGKINTAFMEQHNLTIRQGVSFLVRRIWGTLKSHRSSNWSRSGGGDIITSPATMSLCGFSSPNRFNAKKSIPHAAIAVSHLPWRRGLHHIAGRCWT